MYHPWLCKDNKRHIPAVLLKEECVPKVLHAQRKKLVDLSRLRPFLNKTPTHYILSGCNWTRTHNHLVHKRTLSYLSKPAKLFLNDWAVLWVLICTVHLTLCSCHVTYAFQSEFTLYSCLNVKELLARSGRGILSLSDCNWIRTHNHLVHKRILNHLVVASRPVAVIRSINFRRNNLNLSTPSFQ